MASSDAGPSDRIRTCGIVVPNHARYQLRYTRILRENKVSRESVAIIQHPPRVSKRKIPRDVARRRQMPSRRLFFGLSCIFDD